MPLQNTKQNSATVMDKRLEKLSDIIYEPKVLTAVKKSRKMQEIYPE